MPPAARRPRRLTPNHRPRPRLLPRALRRTMLRPLGANALPQRALAIAAHETRQAAVDQTPVAEKYDGMTLVDVKGAEAVAQSRRAASLREPTGLPQSHASMTDYRAARHHARRRARVRARLRPILSHSRDHGNMLRHTQRTRVARRLRHMARLRRPLTQRTTCRIHGPTICHSTQQRRQRRRLLPRLPQHPSDARITRSIAAIV